MPRKHYTPEQIVTKLKQIEVLMSQGKQIFILKKIFAPKLGKGKRGRYYYEYRVKCKITHVIALRLQLKISIDTIRMYSPYADALTIIGCLKWPREKLKFSQVVVQYVNQLLNW